MLEIGRPQSLDKGQIDIIQAHLDLVFTNVTKPEKLDESLGLLDLLDCPPLKSDLDCATDDTCSLVEIREGPGKPIEITPITKRKPGRTMPMTRNDFGEGRRYC